MNNDKSQILAAVREYYFHHHLYRKEFIPGQDFVRYGGRCFDDAEMVNLVDSALDFWLTAGSWSEKFEEKMADYIGVRHCALVNSGSSANLLAFMVLTAPELGDRRIRRGDEVITVAAGFPTTVAPILQYGAVPVFADVDIPQYNIDIAQLEGARSERTKAVMIAHTLGNPFNVEAVRQFCDKYHLFLVEDNCDALGSEYCCNGKWRRTGSFGDIATSSFYPPHHITMGEGGAVYTDDPLLAKLVNSYRDWGRDCWCSPGRDNSCGQRFNRQFGNLPLGYDHKYVYSHLGYNLKATDMQAAIGCAQLDKINNFTESRRENWQILHQGLEELTSQIILPEPAINSKPSWFGFLITVRDDAGFSRNDLAQYLEQHRIQTRNLFAGNLLRHPVFSTLRENVDYRIAYTLLNTDEIMNNSLWIGVYPGMNKAMLEFMIKTVAKRCKL